MSTYSDTRDEIYNQLMAVDGIGKVFKSQRNPNNWADFIDLYTDKDTSKCIICFISLVHPINEDIDSEDAATDVSRTAQIVRRVETWKIRLIYVFKDEPPSEYDFQELCEKIEEKFRFLQDLNGKAFQSFPLNSQIRDLGNWNNIMVHLCDFQLQIIQRILNDEAE